MENHSIKASFRDIGRSGSFVQFVSPDGLDVVRLDDGVDDVRRLVGVHRRTRADEVLVAVDVVDAADARPQLCVGADERLKTVSSGFKCLKLGKLSCRLDDSFWSIN